MGTKLGLTKVKILKSGKHMIHIQFFFQYIPPWAYHGYITKVTNQRKTDKLKKGILYISCWYSSLSFVRHFALHLWVGQLPRGNYYILVDIICQKTPPLAPNLHSKTPLFFISHPCNDPFFYFCKEFYIKITFSNYQISWQF